MNAVVVPWIVMFGHFTPIVRFVTEPIKLPGINRCPVTSLPVTVGDGKAKFVRPVIATGVPEVRSYTVYVRFDGVTGPLQPNR